MIRKIYKELRNLVTIWARNNEDCFQAGSKVAADESHFITDQNGTMQWVFGMVDIENETH